MPEQLKQINIQCNTKIPLVIGFTLNGQATELDLTKYRLTQVNIGEEVTLTLNKNINEK